MNANLSTCKLDNEASTSSHTRCSCAQAQRHAWFWQIWSLTCQTEYQTEDDEELEEDRQPLKAVKLPAAADSRESRCSGPSRGGVVAATLL